MSHSRRTVLAREFGPPLEVLNLETVAPSVPAAGHVAVRMLASPINPSDLIPVTGAYRSRTALPVVPGFEGVGVISAVHPGEDATLIGRRVLPVGSAGGWQTVKECPVDWCIPVPEEVSEEQAATAYINPLTALRMVEIHAVAPHVRTAVVNAGGSAIAQVLVRLLRGRGIRTIGLCRQPGSVADASLFDALIPTAGGGWEARLARLGPVDLAFDCVGGAEGAALAGLLRHGGTLVHYGLLSGRPLPPSLWHHRPDLVIDLFRLRGWVHTVGRAELFAAFDGVFELVRTGVVRTRVQERLPLAEFRAGLWLAVEHSSRGKVLLCP